MATLSILYSMLSSFGMIYLLFAPDLNMAIWLKDCIMTWLIFSGGIAYLYGLIMTLAQDMKKE